MFLRFSFKPSLSLNYNRLNASTSPNNSLSSKVDPALKSGKPVLLFFREDGCPFCKKQTPIIDELEKEYSNKIAFVRVDVDKDRAATEEMGVSGYPDLFLINNTKNNRYVYREFDGLTEKETLKENIDYLIKNGSLLQISTMDTAGTGNYTYHSCSRWKCYENCIADTYPELNFLEVQRAVLDYLLFCAGVEASQAWLDRYYAAQGLECHDKCEIAKGKGSSAEEIGDCVRCSIAWASNFAPAPASCVVGLFNKLADKLAPHLDCLAECFAPPTTWSQNWGHSCRDKRSPDQYRCNGDNIGIYSCLDCEWTWVGERRCPNGCEETPNGAKCLIKCENDSQCDDKNPCTEDLCTEGGTCWNRPKCIGPVSCTTDSHGRTCCKSPQCNRTDGTCYFDTSCSPGPGGDHPDERNDISESNVTISLSDATNASGIGILKSGFPVYTQNLLSSLGESSSLVEIGAPLEEFAQYPILIIPSGGLSGLDTSVSFDKKIENYVQEGGILISFAQQHGYEFNSLPGGEVTGYGWIEDQSCQQGSAAINTYHPILSGQDSPILDIEVDGYFTGYPKNATILLSRVKNGQPVMILYNYGKGYVVATTAYIDWARSNYQGSSDGTILTRDLLAWAKYAGDIPTFSAENVSMNLRNPLPSPISYPVKEFQKGQKVNLSINVTNTANISCDRVNFLLYDPMLIKHWANVSQDILSNHSKIVYLNYNTTNDSVAGLWTVIYALSKSGTLLNGGYGAEFSLGYDIDSLSHFMAYVTPIDPSGQAMGQKAIPLYMLPGTSGSLNFTVDSKPGIWTARYSVVSQENERQVMVSSLYTFAVSKFSENPQGVAYNGKQINFDVSSDAEEYSFGSNGTFIIQVWNSGDTNRNVTCWWSFPHNFGAKGDPIYGSPGTTTPGHNSNLHRTLSVPAHGKASFAYSVPIYSYDRLWAEFYEGGESSNNYLGQASRGFYVFDPSISIAIRADKQEYSKGEKVQASLNLNNTQSISHNVSVTLRALDPDSRKLYEEIFPVNLSPSASSNKWLNFTLPSGSKYGIYTLTAEAYENGVKIGSSSTYFKLAKDYFLDISFDKPDKAYRIRQNISVHLDAGNYGNTPWNSQLNISIPSLSFSDKKSLSLKSGEIEHFLYILNIPETIGQGKHDVIVTSSYDGSTIKDAFFIPESSLTLTSDKTSFYAGEVLSINLTNAGGVDAGCTCSMKFFDPQARVVYENDSIDKKVLAGETQKLGFEIPGQTASRRYYLIAKCTAHGQNATTTLLKHFTITGINVSLNSTTSKQIYVMGENLSLNTTVVNIGNDIVNSTLDLKIINAAVPGSTAGARSSNSEKNIKLHVMQALPVHNLNTSKDFSTIQGAIDDAKTINGNIISIDPGTYNENLNVNKQIKLKSTSGDPRSVKISAINQNDHAVKILANNVSIQGLTIQNASNSQMAGIYQGIGTNHILIGNCTILNCDRGVSSRDLLIIRFTTA